MIQVRYLRSFDQAFLSLPKRDQVLVENAVQRLLDSFDDKPRPLGLGLRKLKGSFWEVRASLNKRVLFTLDKNCATFIVVGNHDEIRRALGRSRGVSGILS